MVVVVIYIYMYSYFHWWGFWYLLVYSSLCLFVCSVVVFNFCSCQCFGFWFDSRCSLGCFVCVYVSVQYIIVLVSFVPYFVWDLFGLLFEFRFVSIMILFMFAPNYGFDSSLWILTFISFYLCIRRTFDSFVVLFRSVPFWFCLSHLFYLNIVVCACPGFVCDVVLALVIICINKKERNSGNGNWE